MSIGHIDHSSQFLDRKLLLSKAVILPLLSVGKGCTIVNNIPLYQRVVRWMCLVFAGKLDQFNDLKESLQLHQIQPWVLSLYQVRGRLNDKKRSEFDQSLRVEKLENNTLRCMLGSFTMTIQLDDEPQLALWMVPESSGSSVYCLPHYENDELLQKIIANPANKQKLIQRIQDHAFAPNVTAAHCVVWFSTAMLEAKTPEVLMALLKLFVQSEPISEQDKSAVVQLISGGQNFKNISMNKGFINTFLPQMAECVNQEALMCFLALFGDNEIRGLRTWMKQAPGESIKAALILWDAAKKCWPDQAAAFSVSKPAMRKYALNLVAQAFLCWSDSHHLAKEDTRAGILKLLGCESSNVPKLFINKADIDPVQLQDEIIKIFEEAVAEDDDNMARAMGRLLPYKQSNLIEISSAYAVSLAKRFYDPAHSGLERYVPSSAYAKLKH